MSDPRMSSLLKANSLIFDAKKDQYVRMIEVRNTKSQTTTSAATWRHLGDKLYSRPQQEE